MPPEPRVTRRALLSAGAGAALGAVAASTAATARPARGTARDGLVQGGAWTLPAHDLSATRAGDRLAGARVRWRSGFPGGVPASAAIADGPVFAASAAGTVAALALEDGRDRWRRELGTAEYGSGAGRRELGFFAGELLPIGSGSGAAGGAERGGAGAGPRPSRDRHRRPAVRAGQLAPLRRLTCASKADHGSMY